MSALNKPGIAIGFINSGENDITKSKMLINPELPEHFFNLDIDERQAAELKEFWEVPFIMTDKYNPDDYTNYLYRKEFVGIKEILTEAEFKAKVEDERQSWFNAFPTGIAYRVYCLDC